MDKTGRQTLPLATCPWCEGPTREDKARISHVQHHRGSLRLIDWRKAASADELSATLRTASGASGRAARTGSVAACGSSSWWRWRKRTMSLCEMTDTTRTGASSGPSRSQTATRCCGEESSPSLRVKAQCTRSRSEAVRSVVLYARRPARRRGGEESEPRFQLSLLWRHRRVRARCCAREWRRTPRPPLQLVRIRLAL